MTIWQLVVIVLIVFGVGVVVGAVTVAVRLAAAFINKF